MMILSTRLFLVFSICTTLSMALSAQGSCTALSSYAVDECADACFGCQLSGFQGTTNGFTSSGATLCDGALAETNSVWHGFIAATASVSISITPSACTNADGLVAAIYADCGGTVTACNTGISGGGNTPVVLTANLTVGDYYYLMVGGYDGDICNYTVGFVYGGCFIPQLGTIGTITGPANACPDGYSEYSVALVANAQAYLWTAPPGASINNTGLNSLVVDAPLGQNVNIAFGSAGGQVTVKALGICGAATPVASKTVAVQTIPPTNVPPITVYMDELPYFLPHGDVVNSGPGPLMLFTTLSSWQGCDSILRYIVNVEYRPSGVVYWDINGNGIYNLGVDIPVEGQEVSASGSTPAITDDQGYYEFPSLIHNAVFKPSSLPPYALSVTPVSRIFTSGFQTNFNFGFEPQKGNAFGYVYMDENQNGVLDPGEAQLPDMTIKTTSGKIAVTNSNGSYSLSNVAYPELITLQLPPNLESISPQSLPFDPNIPNVAYNFGVRNRDVYGQVLWDIDQTSTVTAPDVAATQLSVSASSGASAMTNNAGFFTFSNLPNGDTLRTNPIAGVASSPAFQVVQQPHTGGYPFLLTPANKPDISLDLTASTVFRPGFITKIYLTIKNESNNYAPAVTAGLRLSSFVAPLTANGNYTYITNDSILWQLGDMPAMTTKTVVLDVRTLVAGVPLGAAIHFHGTAYSLIGDINWTNNRDVIQTVVIGSFDPNDKQVEPALVTPDMLAVPNVLEYTIRFQNTGNYLAELVYIKDTLSPLLNWGTVRPQAASHAYTWSVTPQGVLTFVFENILLPDSSSNEPASHGFVKFTVVPHNGLDIGDKVENFCDIYFDFNDPVRTNTAGTQVVYFLPGTALPNDDQAFSVRPNPAAERLRFSWPQVTTASGIITLYNMNGTPVASVDVPEGSNNSGIEVSWLPNGVYLSVLRAGNVLYARRVVVMHGGGSVRRE